jgi:hypothetical protein
MANTYQLISSNTVGSGGAASVTFSSIPGTYTDLLLKASARCTSVSVGEVIYLSFNSSTTTFSSRYLQGDGASASSSTLARFGGNQTGANATASTFGNTDLYIPNYTSANNKSYTVDTVTENNATTAYATLIAGLWSTTSAITQIDLTPGAGSFVQYSSFYLYGIKNS